MKKVRFALVFILVFALLSSYAGLFASAQETETETTPVQQTATEETSTEGTSYGVPVDLKKQIVSREEVPALIDYQIAVEKKYVCRAYWEETSLNEVVFLRADGALDRYYFSFPVKYEKADGEIEDKNPTLQVRDTLLNGTYRYELHEQNDTVLYCAENLRSGFYFADGDLEVNLRPITAQEFDFLRGHISTGNMASLMPETYDSVAITGTQTGVFSDTDSVTAAVYAMYTEGQSVSFAQNAVDTLSVSPTYTGFQVKLDLTETGAETIAYFALSAPGLILHRQKDTLLLLDAKGNCRGIVGDLLSDNGMVYDAQYTVTTALDGTYLLSAPVSRTDGGSYTMAITSYYDYIQDATIYSVDQNNYGQSKNLWIGYYGGNVGIERVLIRPNNWYYTQSNHYGYQVESANLVIRDITVTTPQVNISSYNFTGSVWTENSVNWQNCGGGNYGVLTDTEAVSSAIGSSSPTGYYYYFNIKNLVSAWYLGTANPAKGIVLRWDQDTSPTGVMEKCFASTQYSTERYRPRLEITSTCVNPLPDGVYYMRSLPNSSPYLTAVESSLNNQLPTLSSCLNGSDPYGHMNQLWRVTHTGNGYYTIRPYHYTPSALVAYSADGSMVLDESVQTYDIGYSDIDNEVPGYSSWRLVQQSTGVFSLQLFGSAAHLGVSSSNTVRANDYYGETSHHWTFTPVGTIPKAVIYYDKETGLRQDEIQRSMLVNESTYPLSGLNISLSVSTDGSIDPAYCSWSVSNSEIAQIDMYPLQITALSEGDVTVRTQLTNNGTFSEFTLHVLSLNFPEGACYIQNADSFLYADIAGQNMLNNNIVHLWEFAKSPCTQWKISLQSNGYYVVQSIKDSDYYLAIIENTNFNQWEIAIKNGTLTDDMYWSFVPTDSGNWRLVPKSQPTKSAVLEMGVSNANGECLILGDYIRDSLVSDEWIISRVNYSAMTINHYYDEGFLVLEGSAGVEVINRLHNTVANVLSQLLDIQIVKGEVEQFESFADQCKDPVTRDNLQEVCNDPNHIVENKKCTDVERYEDKYMSMEETYILNVYWNGHQLYDSSGNKSYNYQYYDIVMMFDATRIVNGVEYENDLGLLHEVSHFLKTPDHYCTSETPCEHAQYCENLSHTHAQKDPRPGWCIMDNEENEPGRWESVEERIEDYGIESLFCEECLEDMRVGSLGKLALEGVQP